MAGRDLPPASGVRTEWPDLPQRVRAIVEDRLGSRVVSAASQPGGFSPGLAERLRTEDGGRLFVKAAGPEPNAQTSAAHRREAGVAAALPREAPVPRLLWSHDEGEGGWIFLAFENVEGTSPADPWRAEELQRVLDALEDLGDLLTPSPLALEMVGEAGDWPVVTGRHREKLIRDRLPGLDDWSTAHLEDLAELEAQAPRSVGGDTLLRLDLRADNLILTPERVLVVDWPHARVGAPWPDVVFFAPSVAMQGGPEPKIYWRGILTLAGPRKPHSLLPSPR